ncbi:MAG: enoyl-CoA hydratase/isomerase family protein [Anaerolineales bacterium]|nr:enoyl-CoA hydratase/isomerase family protein [Anaerolineales bacterium]
MPEHNHWRFDVQEHIATITLNRPDQTNRLVPETFFELGQITEHLAGDNDIWVVILQGEGDHFSIGVDIEVIHQMLDLDDSTFRESLLEMQKCLDTFEALRKPTIAKLHGFCLGGGLILALCCDFRIASERTVFGLPEVKRGIPVIMGTQRLTRIVGPHKTKEMVLLGRNYQASAAEGFGLVHKVVPPDALEEATARFANQFLAIPPRTVGAAKYIIDAGFHLQLRESQDLEIEVQAEIMDSPDLREAVVSFLEDRPPHYIGR